MITKRSVVCAVLITVLCVPQALARPKPAKHRFGKSTQTMISHKLSGGVTWYSEIPGFTEFPFANRDMGYTLFYEYHESAGFWQLGATYVPSPDNDAVRDVWTPEINLILKDSIYHMGVGALKSYVDYGSATEWTDVYWQFVGGIGIPIGSSFSLDLHARYIFESWGDIRESSKGGMGYTALFSLTF